MVGFDQEGFVSARHPFPRDGVATHTSARRLSCVLIARRKILRKPRQPANRKWFPARGRALWRQRVAQSSTVPGFEQKRLGGRLVELLPPSCALFELVSSSTSRRGLHSPSIPSLCWWIPRTWILWSAISGWGSRPARTRTWRIRGSSLKLLSTTRAQVRASSGVWSTTCVG